MLNVASLFYEGMNLVFNDDYIQLLFSLLVQIFNITVIKFFTIVRQK